MAIGFRQGNKAKNERHGRRQQRKKDDEIIAIGEEGCRAGRCGGSIAADPVHENRGNGDPDDAGGRAHRCVEDEGAGDSQIGIRDRQIVVGDGAFHDHAGQTAQEEADYPKDAQGDGGGGVSPPREEDPNDAKEKKGLIGYDHFTTRTIASSGPCGHECPDDGGSPLGDAPEGGFEVRESVAALQDEKHGRHEEHGRQIKDDGRNEKSAEGVEAK